jgi:glycosyltransferase involved in cell wall biosynthesis
MIKAVILTYNEETILAKCLKALHFVDAIIVFDSFSTDRTLDIAKSFNAKVIQRTFDNYASQRNAALEAVSDSCDWILMVDADEIVTESLKTEILNTVTRQNAHTMYRVRRKDMFQDKWIKQSSGYPTWFPRLFKNGCVTVAREINEEYITTGTEGLLQEHLIHYPFNKGLTWWFDKHNRYSEMEAQKMFDELKEPVGFNNLFSKDPTLRRKAQKRLSYRLPLRPTLVFIAFYVLRGGFLNGKAGYTFCKLRKTYEWMIEIKFKELNQSLKK